MDIIMLKNGMIVSIFGHENTSLLKIMCNFAKE
jgi:hypothetical protein